MTPTRLPRPDHPELDLREDVPMLYPELRLAEARERQSLLRSIRESARHDHRPRRPIRRRLGESLMRLGNRIAGEHASSPAWSR